MTRGRYVFFGVKGKVNGSPGITFKKLCFAEKGYPNPIPVLLGVER
jgi:hypothetical protein